MQARRSAERRPAALALCTIVAALGLAALGLSACGDGNNIGGDDVVGRILDASGNPVAGASVRVSGTEIVATTDADGRFGLDRVPVGSYTVTAEATVNGTLNSIESTLFRFENREAVALGDLRLRPLGAGGHEIGQITGFVVDEGGQVVVDARVELTGPGTPVVTRSGTQGGFAFRGVAPGAYALAVTVTGADGVFYRGARSNVAVGTSLGNRLTQNANVVVAPESRLGLLQGRVTDPGNRPVPGARVAVEVLRPDDAAAVVAYNAVTDANGDYVLGTLPTVTAGWGVVISAPGYATFEREAAPTGATTTFDAVLEPLARQGQDAPEDVEVLAMTYPVGGRSSGALRSAISARHRAMGGRLARFARGASTDAVSRASRLAPTGSVIEVDVMYTPVEGGDTAGQVLYRNIRTGFDPPYVPVARSNSPNAFLLADLDSALSTNTTYYYRLTTVGSAGQESGFTSPVETVPLNPLQAIDPPNGDVNLPRESLFFRWVRLAGVRGYQVVLFDVFPSANATAVYVSPPQAADESSHDYDGPRLRGSHAYYWYVVGFNTADPDDAVAETYTPLYTFTTGP